jgi:hypothetical protein
MISRDTEITLASQALMTIHAQHGIQALTVAGGYGVDGNGDRFTLEQIPRVTNEKRNEKGRCTSATYQYDDGSVMEFKWSELLGARYRLGKTVVPTAPTFADPEQLKAARPRLR